jgi:hypothetical protein
MQGISLSIDMQGSAAYLKDMQGSIMRMCSQDYLWDALQTSLVDD